MTSIKIQNYRQLTYLGAFVANLLLSMQVWAADTPNLKSLSDVLPGNYHQSSFYRIDDFYINNNNYIFTIDSEYGKYQIESVGLTLKYLKEIEIVSQVMNQISNDVDSFNVDLQSQLHITADSAIDILSSPLGTATNLAGQLAQNLGDTFAGNSPYVIYESQLNDDEKRDPNLDIHKRNISSQLGLDVYSSNGIVQHMLSELARKRSAGNISSGSVLVNVNRDYEKKESDKLLEHEIQSIIRRNTTEQLYLHNSNILQGFRTPEKLANSFLMHFAYSPSMQTYIIKYLEKMDQLDSKVDFINLLLLASDEVNAAAFLRILKMINIYKEKSAVVREIKLFDNNVSMILEDEIQVVLYPHDYFHQNDSLLDQISERARINDYKKVVFLAYGFIADDAKLDLLDKGIDYVERFTFR